MLGREAAFAEIDQALAAGADSHVGVLHVGVLMVRMQRLREFERIHGYTASEHVSRAMHDAIAASIRPGDVLLQVGECDFAVVLPALRNRNHAALAAAKLARVLQEPMSAGGRQVQVSVVVGGAVSPGDGSDAESLCRNADQGCIDAAGTIERFALYAAADVESSFTYGELRDAIAGNRLVMYLQPIYALGADRTLRAEALSRWFDPQLGQVGPESFIAVAEQTGLIGEFTRWSLNTALRHVSEARAAGILLQLSVNIQVGVMAEPGFVEQLQSMLRFWNVPPDSIVVEVTETGLMADLAHGERQLRRLRDLGFGISIDDFGIGYSSMSYLRRLPATELKIDRSFVTDMGTDPRVARLVGSMIDLAHHMGLLTVAEGVEDAGALTRLRELGCDYVQGYHLARPQPVEAALRMLGPLPVPVGA